MSCDPPPPNSHGESPADSVLCDLEAFLLVSVCQPIMRHRQLPGAPALAANFTGGGVCLVPPHWIRSGTPGAGGGHESWLKGGSVARPATTDVRPEEPASSALTTTAPGPVGKLHGTTQTWGGGACGGHRQTWGGEMMEAEAECQLWGESQPAGGKRIRSKTIGEKIT